MHQLKRRHNQSSGCPNTGCRVRASISGLSSSGSPCRTPQCNQIQSLCGALSPTRTGAVPSGAAMTCSADRNVFSQYVYVHWTTGRSADGLDPAPAAPVAQLPGAESAAPPEPRASGQRLACLPAATRNGSSTRAWPESSACCAAPPAVGRTGAAGGTQSFALHSTPAHLSPPLPNPATSSSGSPSVTLVAWTPAACMRVAAESACLRTQSAALGHLAEI